MLFTKFHENNYIKKENDRVN